MRLVPRPGSQHIAGPLLLVGKDLETFADNLDKAGMTRNARAIRDVLTGKFSTKPELYDKFCDIITDHFILLDGELPYCSALFREATAISVKLQ